MTMPIQGDPGEYSRETRAWLSTMIKIGFTDERGTAWHYRQGDDNHYPGAVPITVAHDLFDFEIEKWSVTAYRGRDGDADAKEVLDPETIAVVAPQFEKIFGYFTQNYEVHPYTEWLVQHTNFLLGGDLQIGSCGLLKDRAVAFLQAEVPETFRDATTGEAFRGSILASTSVDGSLATGYDIVFTRVVCDNTLRRGRNENGQKFRLRHTKNSKGRFESASEALGLLQDETDKFTAEVQEMASQDVSGSQWGKFLEMYTPIPNEKGRGRTIAENKREALSSLYATDERVAPWSGTAWGVLQAVNTYNQHLRTIRKGVARFERNMLSELKGDNASDDQQARKILEMVLS